MQMCANASLGAESSPARPQNHDIWLIIHFPLRWNASPWHVSAEKFSVRPHASMALEVGIISTCKAGQGPLITVVRLCFFVSAALVSAYYLSTCCLGFLSHYFPFFVWPFPFRLPFVYFSFAILPAFHIWHWIGVCSPHGGRKGKGSES